MRLKFISTLIITVFILFGCGTDQNQDGASSDRNRVNIEPTQYQDNDNRYDRNQDRGNGTERLTNRVGDRTRHNVIDDNQNRQNNRFAISEKAANRITDEIAEIDYAYVLTTENNAYVAAVINRDDNQNRQNRDEELTDDIKEKIAKIVQSVDPDIDNVYVSTNPDFVDLVNDYANEVRHDRPIRGMFDQLTQMIERVFPENKR